jgi:phage shock protein C
MNALLVRSRDEVIISGVCGGLAAFMGVNPTYVRLFFVLLIFGNGIGVLLYILLWIMLPLDGHIQPGILSNNVQAGSQEIVAQTRAVGEEMRAFLRGPQSKLGILAGSALILIGLLYLLSSLHLVWLTWLDFDLIWPMLLIFGGLALLFRRSKGV